METSNSIRNVFNPYLYEKTAACRASPSFLLRRTILHRKSSDETAGIVVQSLGGHGNYLAYQEGVGDLNRFAMHIIPDTGYRRVFDHGGTEKLESVDLAVYDVSGLVPSTRE